MKRDGGVNEGPAQEKMPASKSTTDKPKPMAKINVPSYGWNVIGANPLDSIPENVSESIAARLSL